MASGHVHASHLAELQAVEAQLRAERREDAAAEAQIRALAQQHMAAASAASGLPPSTGPGTPPRGPDGVPPSQAQAAPPPPPSAAYDFQAVAAPVEERSPRSVSGGASRGPRHSPGSTVQPSKVVYRSPIYRSASPSRKVGSDGVRISNFSRAPRFKTDKGWVPGPGHYPAHTTFSPPTVRAHVDRSGELGHTWEEYQANTRRGAGMAAVQMDDTRSRAAYQDQTLALQATGEPARSPKGSPTERKLRAEVSGLQQNLQTARSQSAIARHQLYAEVETLQGKLERKTKAHRALGQKVRGWRDHFARLQAATSRLQTALDASIPSIPGDDPMYPLLREINSRAREVSEQVANLGPFVYSTADAVDRSSGAGGARPRVAESEEAQGPSPDEAQRQKEVEEALAKRGIRKEDVAGFASRAHHTAKAAQAEEQKQAAAAARQALIASQFGDAANSGGHFSTRAGFSPVTGQAASREAAHAFGTSTAARDLSSAVSPSVERRARAMKQARERAAAAAGQEHVVDHSAQNAAVRRFGVGEVTVQGRAEMAAAAHAAAKDLTDMQRLQQIFSYYASFGARLEEHPQLKAPQYLRLLRDARALDSRVTSSEVDILFVRAAKAQVDAERAAGAPAGSPSGGVVTTSTRLSFQGFVMVLMMTATLKFSRGMDAQVASHRSRTALIDQVPAAEQQEALARLLRDNILPVHKDLLRDPVFAQDILGVGVSEFKKAFEKEFLAEEVVAWFKTHKGAMESMFYRYSMGSTAAASKGSWAAVRDTHKFLTRAQFLAFAREYKLSEMINRTDLANIFREANRGLEADDASDQLVYVEFLEVLGLIAFNLFDSTDESSGLADSMTAGMVAKLELLFFRMHERGCDFSGSPDEHSFIRSVINSVKRRLGGATSEDRSRTAAATPVSKQLDRAQDILLQALR